MTGVSYHEAAECSESAFVHDRLACLEILYSYSITPAINYSSCIFIECRGRNEYHYHIHRFEMGWRHRTEQESVNYKLQLSGWHMYA